MTTRLVYWQQMVNCRNPRCRYGCAVRPELEPHGPYWYGNIHTTTANRRHTKRVYIGKSLSHFLSENDFTETLHADDTRTPAPTAAPPSPAAPQTRQTKTRPTPADQAALLFLNSRPNAKDAMRFLGASDPAGIKSAYRKAAKAAHPDAGGSTVRMQAANHAKSLLARWIAS